jgi:hypothetical protein
MHAAPVSLRERIGALVPHTDAAPIAMLVQRLPHEGRETPTNAVFDPERGLVGDKWGDRRRDPATMITLMRFDVASALGDPASFGDNVLASIDTSATNLPPGTVVALGAVRCVVTEEPHTGCHKFARRAGDDALALTRHPDFARQQLRGVHLRVIDGGVVSVGDTLRVVSRP